MFGPWWQIWKRHEPDGWLWKLGPFALARYNWFEADSWIFYGFGRVTVCRRKARMPAKTQKQANLMRAAEHGASFPKAQKIRATMTPQQMQDFSTVKPAPQPHANLGKYLHPRKAR